jgi:hypothetical protein
MELHYGQMVNFEAPELFFLLAALCCFHLWQARRRAGPAAGLVICCALAMWMDWQGYLLVLLLCAQLVVQGPARNARMAAALLLAACFSGLTFLLQMRLAMPGAWRELFLAFRERSGNADIAGGAFTAAQWLRKEATYLTTFFHPVAWVLAATGGAIAFLRRRRLSAGEAAPLHAGAVLFIIDAFYLCALRNQSYIHDFAGFCFLIPVAVFSGFVVELMIRAVEAQRPGCCALAATLAGCAMAAGLIVSGIRQLDGIDSQFCILDENKTEPAMLMPDLGRLIENTFPPGAVVLCNFDHYYSPLPYYARHEMANDLHTYADWQEAIADASPKPAGGIVWAQAPDAAELLRRLPANETRVVTVDGIGFVLWVPGVVK